MADASDTAAQQPDSAEAEQARALAAPPRRRRLPRALRWLAWLLAALLALLLLAAGGLWIWAGTDGSLATALRLAGARVPLVTEEVTGNLRGSGKVRHLVWEQGGLRVDVHDAAIQWTPVALLSRTLRIEHLGASRIVIDDQRAPSESPSAGPPGAIRLPLNIAIQQIHAGELTWAGPPAYTMREIDGSFSYDGQRHLLALDHARVEDGTYHARAAVTAHDPMTLDVALAGVLTAPVPGASAPLPLIVQARLQGPVSEMRAQADLVAAEPAAPGASAARRAALPELPAVELPGTGLGAAIAQALSASAPAYAPHAKPPPAPAPPAGVALADVPEAHASALITPWGAQPVPEAHARLRALDVGAIWAEAPVTHLTGQLDITPLPPDATGAAGWAVQADIRNRAPGPWDQRRLPLDRAVADLTWQAGVATVRDLHADLGGGTVASTGRWVAPPAAVASEPAAPAPAPAASAPAPAGTWQIDTRITGVNPAALHTQLAAFPLDGTAQVEGAGSDVDFDIALQARAQRAQPPARAGESAAEALARDLRALRLRDATATGRWTGQVLDLTRLRVRTDEAELSGSARLRPTDAAGPGGSVDVRFTAPGATFTVKGEALPASGTGTLQAQVPDAAHLLAWAQKLPGGAEALAGVHASGNASLRADWRGGWRDPAVQATLAVPRLDARLPGAASAASAAAPAAATPATKPAAQPTTAADTSLIQLRNLQARLSGRLSQADLSVNGQLTQDQRALDLRLAATGGRSTPQAASLADSGWRATISQLQASVRAPELGQGTWLLGKRGAAVPLAWSPAQGGRFDAGAGELVITSPAPVAEAVLRWGPTQWHAGELRSTGQLTGLPLQWAERVAGAQLADMGLTGSVVFNGDWDLALGQSLRLQAHLARASGDLTVLTTDAQTGVQSRVAAGLREARLSLGSDGQTVNARLNWDSAQAGTVTAQLATPLAATRGEGGRTQWSWPEDAALQGQVEARLPQISAWSVLAPPGWRLRGSLHADARIGGTRMQPLVTGTLGADDLALRSVVDGVQFEGGRLRARLDGTRVLIDEFLLRGAGDKADAASGGTLRATGVAGWIDGRAQARLDATLQQLRASIAADRQVTASGSVQAALDGRALAVDGRLRVDRALILLPEESAPSLSDDVIVRGAGGKVMYGKQAPGAVAMPTSAPGQQDAVQKARAGDADAAASEPLTVRANVQLDLGDDFRLRGMGIDTRLAGVLTLTADGPLTTMPRMSGTVRTIGGNFRAYGQMLNITRGNIVFSGNIANPALDIVALRPNYASDQRVGAQVMGTALLPRVRLYSEPALPEGETLAWLLLGRAAPTSGAEAAMLQTAALALLGGREGRGLAATFGLDELSFSGGDGAGGVADASVTLGKRLSDRLYAAYEHSLAGAGGTLLIFYEISRRWTLRGQASENAAVDLIFRLSFD
ncbi:MAG: translocation/assembly module TamB domain-containing protein [Pseudomonadota bacterium]|nr:translocation/assembly module TamB domain-containing protein [Pseudomonadota bacterium]